MSLGCQILEEKGIHGSFEPNVELADFAFGKCNNSNACECHLLEEGGDVLLVAAQPIKGFGNDDIEAALPGTSQKILKICTKVTCPADGVIAKNSNDLPTFAISQCAA